MGFERQPVEFRRAVDFVLAHPARFVFLAVGSPRQEMLAAVVAGPDGNPQLRVGPFGGDLAVAPVEAQTMSRPTWRPSGTELWTVVNGRSVVGVALSGTGPPLAYSVDATELARLGPITQLRLSRDGVRMINGKDLPKE